MDRDGDCDEQAANPSTYARVGGSTALLPGGGSELFTLQVDGAAG